MTVYTMFEEGLMLLIISFMGFCMLLFCGLSAEESIRDPTEEYDNSPLGANYFNICSIIKPLSVRKFKPKEAVEQ